MTDGFNPELSKMGRAMTADLKDLMLRFHKNGTLKLDGGELSLYNIFLSVLDEDKEIAAFFAFIERLKTTKLKKDKEKATLDEILPKLTARVKPDFEKLLWISARDMVKDPMGQVSNIGFALGSKPAVRNGMSWAEFKEAILQNLEGLLSARKPKK